MREQLIQYVKLLFAGTPNSEDMQQEILQNTLDRYDDLIAQGKSPEAAYRLAIAGIGDINELLTQNDEAKSAPPSQPSNPEAEVKSSRKKVLSGIAIALYICSVIPVITLGNVGSGILGVCLMFVIIAVATLLIVIASNDEKQEITAAAEVKEKKPKSIWGTITLVLYLALSFATQAWHITWLIFPIEAAIKGLVKALQGDGKGKAITRAIPYSLLTVILVFLLVAGLGLRGLPIISGGTTVNGEVSLDANDIKNLQIDWLSGDVTIQPADTDQISIAEASAETIRYNMAYQIDGDTLQLSFSNRIFIFGNWSVPDKDLIITVPQDWICDNLEINGASMAITITDIHTDTLTLDGASCALNYSGSVNQVEINGASMDIQLNCTNRISDIDVDGASCDLKLSLPQGCGFVVDVDGLSYALHTDLPIRIQGDQKTYGDQHCRITIDGISCEITIAESEQAS